MNWWLASWYSVTSIASSVPLPFPDERVSYAVTVFSPGDHQPSGAEPPPQSPSIDSLSGNTRINGFGPPAFFASPSK
jgi:hypothetical protein